MRSDPREDEGGGCKVSIYTDCASLVQDVLVTTAVGSGLVPDNTLYDLEFDLDCSCKSPCTFGSF